MPTITIRANQSGGSSLETFSERVVAAHLRDEHYATQLIERLMWATIDAEALELASNRANTDVPGAAAGEPRTGRSPRSAPAAPRRSTLGRSRATT